MKNQSDTPSLYKDLLHYHKYARGLAHFIVNSDYPLTIGVSWEWWYGKTTLMHYIAYYLDSTFFKKNKASFDKKDNSLIKEITNFHKNLQNSYKVIFLNTWPFINSKDLWRTIFEQIMFDLSQIIKEDDKWLEKGWKFLLRTISWVLKTLKLNAKISLPGLEIWWEFDPSKCEMDDLFGDNITYTFKSEIELILNEFAKKKWKLLICVDDLDRLYPSQALEVILFIKNFLDTDNCIFIIGSDNKVVTDGLKKLYWSDQKDFLKLKKDFFEKIYQLEFKFPGIQEDEIEDYLNSFENIADLFEKNDDSKPSEVKKILKIFNPSFNPRKIKRTINLYNFILSLVDYKGEEQIDDIKLCIFEIAILYEYSIDLYNHVRLWLINHKKFDRETLQDNDLNDLFRKFLDTEPLLTKYNDAQNKILKDVFKILWSTRNTGLLVHNIKIQKLIDVDFVTFENFPSDIKIEDRLEICAHWVKSKINENNYKKIVDVFSENSEDFLNRRAIVDNLKDSIRSTIPEPDQATLDKVDSILERISSHELEILSS